MARLVGAGRQFAAELEEIDPDIDWSSHGDPDGFGRLRAVSVDAEALPGLRDVIAETGDERIESARRYNKRLIVTFVPTPAADHRHPFGIAAGYEESDGGEPEDDEEE